jgi:hypothetical protein
MKQHGHCKLCLKIKDLVLSHYVPSSLYKKCLEQEDGKINHPILASKSPQQKHALEHPISFQARDYVLCRECENKFNKNGETYFLSLYNEETKSFRIKDDLSRLKPKLSNQESSVYSNKLHKLSYEQLTYFALSIFWRGSVNKWQINRKPIERIYLNIYQETIRKFLNDTTTYPDHVYLSLWISTTKREGDYFRFPYSTKASNFYFHQFLVSNLLFTLSVGKNTPESLRKFCLYSSEEHPIVLSSTVDVILLKFFKVLFPSQNFNTLQRLIWSDYRRKKL